MVDSSDALVNAEPIPMQYAGQKGKDHVFEGSLPFTRSGKTGFNIRVLPSNTDMANYQDLMLITWASE